MSSRSVATARARLRPSDASCVRTISCCSRRAAAFRPAERQARAQYDEGAITTPDYVETRTDVLEARLTLERHRVELAQARARYLTTLGITTPIPSDTP